MIPNNMGKWAFLVGALLAIIVGLLEGMGSGSVLGSFASYVPALLVLAGLIVGFVNISAKEVQPFLVAAVAVLLAGTTGLANLPAVGATLVIMINNVLLVVAPAALVVALRAVYGFAAE